MDVREWISIGLLVLLVLLILLLLISRNKAVREKKVAQRTLEDTLTNLEAVYSEVNTTQEELNTKYRELKASEDKIKKLAYEDAMTGLPNRAAFLEVLDHTMDTLRRDESIAVISLDLDNFKMINNLWGNACGDELILDVSHRLKQNLDDNDYLARSGSDEFVILSQNIGEIDEYEEKVKRIQKAFRYPFVLSVGEFVITLSLGVVIGPRDGKNAGVLMKRADSALAQAKWLGKNTYCYYTESLEQKQLEDMELRTDLTAAMKQNDFFLRYQPILRPQEGVCTGLRAELWWDRKEKGVWRAGRFIRFAEETGQIIALGERVFRRLCKDVKEWEDTGVLEFNVIVPLSRRQYLSPSFEQTIRTISLEEGVSLNHFLFEIGEGILVSDYEDCCYIMQEQYQRGLRFRIGDFGSGRTSLDCIRNMPVEQVAVSYRRIFDEHELAEAEEYLSVVVTAIRSLRKDIVVTGIADVQEEQRVQKVGTTKMQGELYGESLSAEEITRGCQTNIAWN